MKEKEIIATRFAEISTVIGNCLLGFIYYLENFVMLVIGKKFIVVNVQSFKKYSSHLVTLYDNKKMVVPSVFYSFEKSIFLL